MHQCIDGGCSTCSIGIKDGKIRTLVDEFTNDELEGVEVIDAE